MIQKVIKVLTLGFFISMITGFVFYRTGYFDSIQSSNSLQTSPNGGEFLIANVDQYTNRIPQINQNNMNNQAPIMPSSKSAVPVIRIEKQEEEKVKIMPSSKSLAPMVEIKIDDKLKDAMMSSSKSTIHAIDVDLTKQKPDLDSLRKEIYPENSKATSTEIQADDGHKSDSEKPTGISWGLIGLGVLGILFVGIGSIVYFKRKSR